MRVFANALLPLFLTVSVFATTQKPDTLIIGNENRKVYGIDLPEHVLTRLDAWKKKHDLEGVSSANWKGFYATLRLAKDHLLVEAVTVDGAGFTTAPVPMRYLFGASPPIPALWFSGELKEYLFAPFKFTDILPSGGIRAGIPPDILRRYIFRKGKLKSQTKEILPR